MKISLYSIGTGCYESLDVWSATQHDHGVVEEIAKGLWEIWADYEAGELEWDDAHSFTVEALERHDLHVFKAYEIHFESDFVFSPTPDAENCIEVSE